MERNTGQATVRRYLNLAYWYVAAGFFVVPVVIFLPVAITGEIPAWLENPQPIKLGMIIFISYFVLAAVGAAFHLLIEGIYRSRKSY
jgi:uncharacterized membrane protein